MYVHTYVSVGVDVCEYVWGYVRVSVGVYVCVGVYVRTCV